MLNTTLPLVVSAEHVWLLVHLPNGTDVDAARLAYMPTGERFLALPCAAFDTTSVLPTYLASGELVTGYRWATVTDVDTHADRFTPDGVRWNGVCWNGVCWNGVCWNGVCW